MTEFNQKRPWGNRIPQSRISSWADPVSARGVLQSGEEAEEGKSELNPKRGSKGKSRLGEESLVGSEVPETEEPEEAVYDSLGERSEGGEEIPRRGVRYGPRR